MRRAVGVSLVLFLNLVGCNGDDTSSDDIAGVPRSTALKDVSNSQVVELCKVHEARLESINNCHTAGLDEDSEAACMTTISACEKSTPADSSDIDCADASNSNFKDCSVSLGEFSDCLGELASYIGSLTCKDAGKTFTPPSCVRSLTSQCGEDVFD